MGQYLPDTTERVEEHTSDKVNEEISEQTKRNIEYYKNQSKEEIDKRLEELEAEWDTERVLEANASTLILIGTTLGATVSRKWLALPLVVSSFLLQHALQGWCPPLAVLRRLGIRTANEINEEKTALKEIRGDFH
ncbi:DUF2892 domain-containing protein [Evansella sp. LMS18]|uniref:DUF2892 domain-containing protein n=1 Tax=Evansella sp. LMS18 TaxID=2924033 RepID=UPI0020D1E8A5|nr:DUF2892 domain-containing protein [Evansella sp. LMS18]UTR11557.1 DUF2892 domain-containing protein [Evansella sp. LMS18]